MLARASAWGRGMVRRNREYAHESHKPQNAPNGADKAPASRRIVESGKWSPWPAAHGRSARRAIGLQPSAILPVSRRVYGRAVETARRGWESRAWASIS